MRDVFKQRIERCKTEASRKPVPIGAEVTEFLWAWRLRCAYNEPGDWVFASPATKGRQPSGIHQASSHALEDQRSSRLAHPAA